MTAFYGRHTKHFGKGTKLRDLSTMKSVNFDGFGKLVNSAYFPLELGRELIGKSSG